MMEMYNKRVDDCVHSLLSEGYILISQSVNKSISILRHSRNGARMHVYATPVRIRLVRNGKQVHTEQI